MASSPDSLPANARLILGPPVVGIVLNWFFYGILLMQYLMYLNNGREDKKWLRATVHFMLLLDTIQSIMMMDDLFFWFVYNLNDYSAAVFRYNLSTIDGPFLDAFIMFIAQIVYCWRLRELGKWTVLPAATAFLALVSCIFYADRLQIMFLDSVSSRKYSPVEDLWLLSSAVTDITIASSMTYLLHPTFVAREVSKRVPLHEEEYGNPLEAYGYVDAGDGCYHSYGFTCALYLRRYTKHSRACKKTNINVALGNVIGKMYSNCFMVLLNQRIYYDKYVKANPTTVILGGTSRVQGDGHNETTAPPMSMLQFNDIGTTTGTTTETSEHSHVGAAKNGQEMMNSVPNEIV
ncbi:hypothetical protein D9756_006281 [Leucocoprinus leucothites]|uniref:Uncharacterized protein n=1 Tax=Leucocoprinus leucothites TaxID=201217 RepID=A0A8H5FWU7_9AGAR|nr:hypothetical protein D9756_006281 [Leucoagaricus leucothites]